MGFSTNDISRKLNELDAKKKISKIVLANMLGYDSRQSIYDMFNGKKKHFKHEDLIKLAQAYEVSVDYFYDATTQQKEKQKLYKPQKDVFSIRVKAEKISHLLEENHKLWIENSILKRVLLENNIDISDTFSM